MVMFGILLILLAFIVWKLPRNAAHGQPDRLLLCPPAVRVLGYVQQGAAARVVPVFGSGSPSLAPQNFHATHEFRRVTRGPHQQNREGLLRLQPTAIPSRCASASHTGLDFRETNKFSAPSSCSALR